MIFALAMVVGDFSAGLGMFACALVAAIACGCGRTTKEVLIGHVVAASEKKAEIDGHRFPR